MRKSPRYSRKEALICLDFRCIPCPSARQQAGTRPATTVLRMEVKRVAETKSKDSGAATRAQGAPGAKKAAGKGKATTTKKGAPRANTGAQDKTSGLDAAAKVLAEADGPLSCKQMVEAMFEKGYWKSSGKTPAATIYSSILREIQKKGDASRFRKAERGRFALAK